MQVLAESRVYLFALSFNPHLQNPVETIQSLAQFLGVERSREFCEGVNELSSFSSMKSKKGKEAQANVNFSIQRKGMKL